MKNLKTLVILLFVVIYAASVLAQATAGDAKTSQPAPAESKAKAAADAKAKPPVAATPAPAPAKTAVSVTVKKLEEQTVLYTLYRGSYDQIGAAIGQLYTVAVQYQIQPAGAAYLTFLNNPKLIAPAHWLTEIRIPVSPTALNLSGSLGMPMTDIKRLPPMEVAATVKPAGVADPAPIYAALNQWIQENHYTCIDTPMEKYPQAMTGSYTDTATEIMMPIEKSIASSSPVPSVKMQDKK
jgi:effector-binding domain-containing protein